MQSYEDLRLAIEAELRRKKQAELLNKLVLTLKNRYGVKINEDVFEAFEKTVK